MKIFAWLLAGFLAFAAPTPAAAVATAKTAVTNTAWVSLGAGPLLISADGPIVYAIGDSIPSISLNQGYRVNAFVTFTVNTPSQVWVMAQNATGANVFNAPVLGPSAGGGGTLTNGSTATAGFTAGQIMMSNGSLLQAVPSTDYGVTNAGAWSVPSLIVTGSGNLYSPNFSAYNTTINNNFISGGTQPTITGTGGTCATTTKVGGGFAGTVVLSAVCATTNTLVWTGMPGAPNGWACDATNRTHPTSGPFPETASTTTGFTITVGATSTTAADVLQWECIGY
jgi:hypothetical protein